MSTRTTITGVTVPDVSDDLGDFLGAVVQGFTDLQNFLFLPVDSKNAGDDHTTYPVGISLLPLSAGTPANGWPAATGVMLVITIRRGNTANGALQYWVAFQTGLGPQIKVRTGASAGWMPWIRAAGTGLPLGADSGVITFNSNANADTRTISFTTAFDSVPNVVPSAQGAAYTAYVTAISKTGCTLGITPQDGGTAMPSTADRSVQWIAMQT